MTVTIYHNPDCGTSRNVLGLLKAAGSNPQVIEYLQTPPSGDTIRDLARRTPFGLRGLLRERGTPFQSLGLENADLSDQALLDAVAAHPILLNRPLVVSPRGVRLCRPSDIVLDLIDAPNRRIDKEEGAPFLKDNPVAGANQDLRSALTTNDLPTDDLAEPGRQFLAFAMTDGTICGYGGFERFDQDVLLRSIVVLPPFRGSGLGRNLVPLLLYRAYEQGARRAWAFTQTAAPFFEKLNFKPTPREAAPAPITSTRQAQGLCPASATLLTRTIGF